MICHGLSVHLSQCFSPFLSIPHTKAMGKEIYISSAINFRSKCYFRFKIFTSIADYKVHSSSFENSPSQSSSSSFYFTTRRPTDRATSRWRQIIVYRKLISSYKFIRRMHNRIVHNWRKRHNEEEV